MGKKIALTENDIKNMVNATVKKLIKEYYGTFDDTTSAPWNKISNDEPYKNEGEIDNYMIDLSDLVSKHPELRRFLKSIATNGDFSESNLGKVKVTWEEYDSPDEEPEVISDTYKLSLDDTNPLKRMLPDKLINILETLIQKDFEQNGEHDWID